MKVIGRIPDVSELKSEFALTAVQEDIRLKVIGEIQSILKNESNKKIVLVGPCSADREDAVLEYMLRLAKLREEVGEKLCVIPRIYTSKPRTNGTGYKGLLHRPNSANEVDNIRDGIIAIRKMHLKIVQETEMFGVDEMLYPEMHQYVADLLAYTAVGARSVENQQHRLVASGLDMPVGMKNPTSGDNEVMLNAILAAQCRQRFVLNGFEYESCGNPYAHSILRGYTDSMGKMHSNYHFEDLVDLFDMYQKKNLKNASVIIDCNHGNSRKHYDEQMRIANEVFHNVGRYDYIDVFVKGIMIESYLEDGCQMIGENIYGKSITDACLGWEKTERLIKELADKL